MKKRTLKRKLAEEAKKEREILDAVPFPQRDLSLRKFTEFVINDFIASLGEDDKKYIIENQDPMDYYFSTCLYLRNHYIANFTDRGYKIIGDDGRACQGDHFRENYSVTMMYKIIKRICEKANVEFQGHKPFGFYEED